MGSNVSFEDFTIGFTKNKNEADFIISKSNFPDFKIKAGNNITFPDIKITVSKDVTFPDVKIKIIKAGIPNYLIYNEKDFTNIQDVTVVLLPIINVYTKNKNKKLIKFLIRNRGN